MGLEKIGRKVATKIAGAFNGMSAKKADKVTKALEEIPAEKTLAAMDTMSAAVQATVKKPVLSDEALAKLKEKFSDVDADKLMKKIEGQKDIADKISGTEASFSKFSTTKMETTEDLVRETIENTTDEEKLQTGAKQLLDEARRGAKELMAATGRSDKRNSAVWSSMVFDQNGLTETEKALNAADKLAKRKAELTEKYGEKLKLKKINAELEKGIREQ